MLSGLLPLFLYRKEASSSNCGGLFAHSVRYNAPMAKRDYYDVLGLKRDASGAQIKSAYRKRAKNFHPDVNGSPDAAEKFKEATEAYEVLCDPQKRKTYDTYGHAGAGEFAGRPGARTYTWSTGQGAPFDLRDFFGRSQSPFMDMGLDEILGALRGGKSRGRRKRRTRGADLEHHINLDFLAAVRGTTVSLRVQLADDASRSETIEVKIPPGVREASRVRIRGKGAPGTAGPGDLYLIVHVANHPYFRTEGDDIYVDVPISIVEAALGAKVDVPTLDGMTSVSVPAGTGGGKRLRLRGKGVAKGNSKTRGDQYIVIKVVPPEKISKRGKELLDEFARTETPDVRKDVPWK